MNNLINLLRKYNGKVARVLCSPSFMNSMMAQPLTNALSGRPLVEVDIREEYRLELTDGRVVHQDGSVDVMLNGVRVARFSYSK